jgi:YHS domain-containing protein
MRSSSRIGSFALVLAFLVGCGGSGQSTESSSTETSASTGAGGEAAAARVVPPGEATIGDTTTCPVSGETFVVTDASPHAEHEGRTYYFCCPGCDARFQANPAQYLQPQPAAEESTPAS